jgi:hypothetical protein
VAVIDSSPLINLAHLNLALELANFFDRVYVPRAVHRELNRKGRFRYRLNKLYATGVFERCAAADATNVSSCGPNWMKANLKRVFKRRRGTLTHSSAMTGTPALLRSEWAENLSER